VREINIYSAEMNTDVSGVSPRVYSGIAAPIRFVLIFFGIIFAARFAVMQRSSWGVDFNQFYSAGKLTGTGHLYEWEPLRRLEAERGDASPTGRLPVVLYVHKLLGRLPYHRAQAIWAAISVLALIGFVLLWPSVPREIATVALIWSIPSIMLLVFGQDTPFWMCFFAAGLFALKRSHPVWAGIAFSLCICKFQLGRIERRYVGRTLQRAGPHGP
jgi:hypothetical protein